MGVKDHSQGQNAHYPPSISTSIDPLILSKALRWRFQTPCLSMTFEGRSGPSNERVQPRPIGAIDGFPALRASLPYRQRIPPALPDRVLPDQIRQGETVIQFDRQHIACELFRTPSLEAVRGPKGPRCQQAKLSCPKPLSCSGLPGHLESSGSICMRSVWFRSFPVSSIYSVSIFAFYSHHNGVEF